MAEMRKSHLNYIIAIRRYIKYNFVLSEAINNNYVLRLRGRLYFYDYAAGRGGLRNFILTIMNFQSWYNG
jgi:hypothetical protein